MFDEQPDGDPHGECAAEIHRLEAENAKLREAFRDLLSVRDQFAKAAMTGCLPGSRVDPDEHARWAYRMADAMMRARQAAGEAAEREGK